MWLRTAVLAAAGFGIPLALLVLALPITWGYGGYLEEPHSGLNRFAYVDPTGPAARAGLRVGEITNPLRGMDEFDNLAGPVGTTVIFHVVRGSGTTPVPVTFEQFKGVLATQELLNKILGALTALGAFIVAILVALRARNPRAGARASAVLAAAGLAAVVSSGALVVYNSVLATLGSSFSMVPYLLSGATFWAAFSLLEIYPPRPTRIRSFIGKLGPWIFAGFAVTFASSLYGYSTGQTAFEFVGRGAVGSSLVLFGLIAFIVAMIDAVATAPPEYAAPTRWLAGSWSLAAALMAIQALSGVLHIFPVLGSHYADVLRAAQVFFLGFGVAYPVLRHRMVDLNILVTRATVFAVVSLIIVGIFVAVEWIVGRIFEESMGVRGATGVAPQAVTLAVVLILGISARSIHRFVEVRLTQTFFRKRLRGLAEIRRVAREADATTDARAIMELACTTVRQCLDSLGVACYVRAGDGYALTSTCGSVISPAAYAFNEPVPLRLRRWQEPFEVDDDSDARHHMLFLPMTLRAEVLGFLCCGPKPDRTPYAEDEVEALSLLAQQIGIAAAWLDRGRIGPSELRVVET